MTRRGIPTRPAMRSESANEVRNIFVSVLSDFFLWIKKMTTPLTETIVKEMRDKSTTSGEGRIVSPLLFSVSLLEMFSTQLVLYVLRWHMLIIRPFARSKSSFQFSCCPSSRRANCSPARKQNGTQTRLKVLHEPVPLSKQQQFKWKTLLNAQSGTGIYYDKNW